MKKLTKAEQYLICKQRGHDPDHDAETPLDEHGEPDYHRDVCKWCGTVYWEETIEHETNTPEPTKIRKAVES